MSFNAERLLHTLASLFATQGRAAEVALLAHSAPRIQQTGVGEWNDEEKLYTLYLETPVRVFVPIADRCSEIERELQEKVRLVTRGSGPDFITQVVIRPQAPEAESPGWRDRAKRWLAGEGVNNQGRVRSDNIAPLEVDGLLFRSQEEVNLYRAFKWLGVAFAPLPVFLRGGEEYRRLEPDFVVLKDGIVMVVEVDGDTVHNETPAEAHDRTTVLAHAGAYIERVPASFCRTPESARQTAEDLLAIMAKHKLNR